MKNNFKGNKSSLPSKPCTVCQRPMSWRKAWAKNWESVRYCSDACRANKGSALHRSEAASASAAPAPTQATRPTQTKGLGPAATPPAAGMHTGPKTRKRA